ncbi:carbohydrate sulfotransferase 15-like isoform X1 [Mercenaria mercenaria]|uniref:carbohydrate sulfotransferase 15-like isoform X1 n=1 Tax=Mercenaria mercenaria TaxID=6596 RepID=UPI00234E764A|nr:carbohydrate sulfotransferase 15-like isoform X1 [Mercenaria mercenaria]
MTSFRKQDQRLYNICMTIRRFIRRHKFNMICLVSKFCRQCINIRARDGVKYIQVVVTVILLAYLGTVHLHDFFSTKERLSEKIGINLTKKETQFPYLHVTLPRVTFRHQLLHAKTTLSQKTATTALPIDPNVFRRNDTTPELTEKLPFLSDYKSPCWRELDEILKPDIRLNCLPYFYVVGVSQCGTKDLFERLTQHPLISSNVKAGNRWLTRLRFAGFPNLSDYLQYYYRAVETDIKRLKTKEGYHNAIFGDFTPSTIWDNHLLNKEAKKLNMSDPPYTHADVIKRLNPNARIIALLCDPTERLFQDYLGMAEENEANPYADEFHAHVKASVKRFSNCLKNTSFLRCVYFGKPPSSYRAAGLVRIEIGLYHVHLENFMKIFPRNQILIVQKEQLDKQPVTVIRDIFRFLDVGNMEDPTAWQKIVFNTGTDLIKRPIGDMRPDTRKLIQDFYKPYNDRLTQLLGPEFDYNKNSSLVLI